MNFSLGGLLDLARSEGVLALLCEKVLHAVDAVAPDQLAQLKQVHYGEIAGEMWLHNELVSVFSSFESAGVQCLVFKGAALAYCHYPAPYLRQRCDADLLFANRLEADRAAKLLFAQGYGCENFTDGELITAEFTCVKALSNGMSVALDLHWHTNNSPQFRFSCYSQLAARAIPLAALSPYAKAPCGVDAFFIACLHRLAHQPEGLENRLIWLYDIFLFMRTFTPAELAEVVDIAQRCDLAPACVDALMSCNEYFPIDLGGHWYLRLEELARASKKTAVGASSLLAVDMRRILLQPGLWQKMRLVKEYLFPSRAYMMKKYQNQSSNLFYCYMHRMYFGLLKRLKR